MTSPPADRPAAIRDRQTGFTLIEMMVVLAVMGLMLGLVLTHGDLRSPSLMRRDAVGQIVQALRLARSQAVMVGQVVPVVFDVADRRFRIGQGTWQGLAPALTMAVAPASLDRSTAIRFAPDGSAGGGRVVVAGGGQQVEIGVDQLTGRVSIQNAR